MVPGSIQRLGYSVCGFYIVLPVTLWVFSNLLKTCQQVYWYKCENNCVCVFGALCTIQGVITSHVRIGSEITVTQTALKCLLKLVRVDNI